MDCEEKHQVPEEPQEVPSEESQEVMQNESEEDPVETEEN